MLENYLKVILRNFLKRKLFTLINILGLAVGMAVCLLILLYIQDEFSFDSYQLKGDRIYRMVVERKYPDRSASYAKIPNGIAGAVMQEFPEVKNCTRIFDFIGTGKFLVKIGKKNFEEKNVFVVDSNFFEIFTAKFLQGDSATALQKKNTVVINESTAIKYFGTAAKAMGKSLETEWGSHLLISAVVQDWPGNSHFNFDLLMTDVASPFIENSVYTSFTAYTYLLLNNKSSPKVLETKFPLLIDKYVSGEIGRSFGVSYQQFQSTGNGYHYYLQPLRRIHLISDLEAEFKPNGNLKAVYAFGMIAIFILFIGCINFINISTARSIERAKEVGLRKTFGSDKNTIIKQFLLESTMVSMMSLFVAILLIFVSMPGFNKITGKALSLIYFFNPKGIISLFVFSIVTGFIAGIYPAFVLSSFKPVTILKGKFKSSKYGVALRNGLVIFQFAISIFLIICATTVSLQMKYMLGTKLGFKKDHIIEIDGPWVVYPKNGSFKAELLKMPGVEMVSGASAMPGQQSYFGSTFMELGSKESMSGKAAMVDEEFVSVLGLQLKEGRFFSKAFSTDSLSVVLSEKAVEELGLKKAIGARIISTDGFYNAPDGKQYVYTVIGVVKDFFFQPMQQKVPPLVLLNTSKFGDAIMPVTTVRIKTGDIRAVISDIQKVWKKFMPERPLHYTFLDENLAAQYKKEQTEQEVFIIFCSLAIFIACIGLLGLTTYTTLQRMREISIRRVLGATPGNIIRILSKDFMRLVIISALVAFPIAGWVMQTWLENFAYHTNLSWWVYLLAGLISVFIAFTTIGFQVIKAAVANPVDNLRWE